MIYNEFVTFAIVSLYFTGCIIFIVEYIYANRYYRKMQEYLARLRYLNNDTLYYMNFALHLANIGAPLGHINIYIDIVESINDQYWKTVKEYESIMKYRYI